MTEEQVVNVIAKQIREYRQNGHVYYGQKMLKAAEGQFDKAHTLETLAFALGVLDAVNAQTA